MAQTRGHQQPTWETWMKFSANTVGLDHSHLGSESVDGKELTLPVTLPLK